MNFAEATKELKEGRAIRRKSWEEYFHIKIETINSQDFIKSYRQECVPFNYSSDIIFSDDWMVVGEENNIIDFPSAVEKLKCRYKIKLKEWPSATYIETHPNGKELWMRKITETIYTPSFECFCATDWEIFE